MSDQPSRLTRIRAYMTHSDPWETVPPGSENTPKRPALPLFSSGDPDFAQKADEHFGGGSENTETLAATIREVLPTCGWACGDCSRCNAAKALRVLEARLTEDEHAELVARLQQTEQERDGALKIALKHQTCEGRILRAEARAEAAEKRADLNTQLAERHYRRAVAAEKERDQWKGAAEFQPSSWSDLWQKERDRAEAAEEVIRKIAAGEWGAHAYPYLAVVEFARAYVAAQKGDA